MSLKHIIDSMPLMQLFAYFADYFSSLFVTAEIAYHINRKSLHYISQLCISWHTKLLTSKNKMALK